MVFTYISFITALNGWVLLNFLGFLHGSWKSIAGVHPSLLQLHVSVSASPIGCCLSGWARVKITLITDTIQSTWLIDRPESHEEENLFFSGGYFDISTCLFELFEHEGLTLDMQAKTNLSKKDSSTAEMLNCDWLRSCGWISLYCLVNMILRDLRHLE